MDPRPGTAAFLQAIDAARNVAEIDVLVQRLNFSSAEFCRWANVGESWYSRNRRNGEASSIRPRSLRKLQTALHRLVAEDPRYAIENGALA